MYDKDFKLNSNERDHSIREYYEIEIGASSTIGVKLVSLHPCFLLLSLSFRPLGSNSKTNELKIMY